MTDSPKEIPSSVFADDAGTADPRLAQALASGAELSHLVAVMADARVLVPVMASGEQRHAGAHGWDVDAVASTGVVALRAPDGRTALPIFTDVGAVSQWHPNARPIPAEGPRAALAAVAEGWSLLVLNPGGEAVVIPRPAVWSLAQGVSWTPAVQAGVVHPDVRVAVREALSGQDHIVAVDAEPGTSAELCVVVTLVSGLSQADLSAVTETIHASLGTSQLIADRVDSIQVRVQGE